MRDLFTYLTLCTILAVFLSCSTQKTDNIYRGSSYQYQEGQPVLLASAMGLILDDTAKIKVNGNIVYGSLIYSSKDSMYKASASVNIRIYPEDEIASVAKSRRFQFTVEEPDPSIVNSHEVLPFEKLIDIEPGTYRVEVEIIDLSSRKNTIHTTEVTVPDPNSSAQYITSIDMLAKALDEPPKLFFPVTTYNLSGRFDSLKFRFQVSNYNENQPMEINSRLIKFESDTTPAASLSMQLHSSGSIKYEGINYHKKTVIQSTNRTIYQTGSIIVQFTFPMLNMGNYRFEVFSRDSSGKQKLYKAREFGVRSEHFPTLKTPRELARPLIYLMDRGPYEEMMKIQNSDSIKAAMDDFWLSNFDNREFARRVISKYYNRVEQANKRYSNFKEGWKTDRGMVYILFGDPTYVTEFSDELRWDYTYGMYSDEYSFYFLEPRMQSNLFPFEHWVLQRGMQYYHVENQQKYLWLSGRILHRR